jgi:hypothetical protein
LDGQIRQDQIFTVGVFSALLLRTTRQLYWFLRSQICQNLLERSHQPFVASARARTPLLGAIFSDSLILGQLA